MNIENRLASMGLTLPNATTPPSGVDVPFEWARVHRDRIYISGHGPLKQDGIVAPPFGRRVGAEVTPAQAYEAARLATLAMLGSIRREVGDLDRISA